MADVMNRLFSLPPSTDEHIYKLVQICRETMITYKDDAEFQKIGSLACEVVLTHDLYI